MVRLENGSIPLEDVSVTVLQQKQYTRDYRFWMVFVANLTVDMLSALDLVSANG